ncbi:hypothetical protein PSECIP111951_00062 [Pseudoalteromonas holothuriae]|uniref:M23ase beta-sheet core domain-containing protein n=1 Tax=Pseudoalteromonas holothuriae TaxID=2963714 RepID=A0ABM9GCW2_9GAMM|nr:M23 family metallopeptidase [Pseudoalteromonas sp. CIP111951]CAH9049875.1 hypothetical protein PSECIP111951_00062 [Pseudoalteromonas sp. CIP111951]
MKKILFTVLSTALFGCVENVSDPKTEVQNNVSQATVSHSTQLPKVAQMNEQQSKTNHNKTTKTLVLSVKAGQSLIGLLKPFGFTEQHAWQVTELVKPDMDLNRLNIGQKFQVEYNEQGLVALIFAIDFAQRLRVIRNETGWHKALYSMLTKSKQVLRSTTVSNSLYEAAQQEGVPLDVINQMIMAFSHFIDFQRQIQSGDQLTLMFNEQQVLVADALYDRKDNPTQLLYGHLVAGNESFEIFHHQGDKLIDGFYFADGRPARSLLLKTPLNGAHLSSQFGRRKHPILGYTRLHAGLDFGAPMGTPIFAAGNGTVEKANWGGSFGNRVLLRHAHGYKTLYAHLKGFAPGIKPGVKVKQGQTIGYLGNTGLSQARHLHYEVHKNGKPINPLLLKKVSQVKMQGSEFAWLQDTVINIQSMLEKERLAMNAVEF